MRKSTLNSAIMMTFDTEFMQIGSNVKGKALDRSGICTSLINAIDKEYKYDTYMCFLVQREVGARGAKIVSHRINADVILSVSSAEQPICTVVKVMRV